MSETCDVKIAVYIPARKSIYMVTASDLPSKLDSLRQHKDILFRFFHVLSATQERDVRAALNG